MRIVHGDFMDQAWKCTSLMPHSMGHDSDLSQHLSARKTGRWHIAVRSQEEETDIAIEQRTFFPLILLPQLL